MAHFTISENRDCPFCGRPTIRASIGTMSKASVWWFDHLPSEDGVHTIQGRPGQYVPHVNTCPHVLEQLEDEHDHH